ncbi:MAG: hypothetical protein QXT19_01645 [Candidatus Woesearchaeota archaeon]
MKKAVIGGLIGFVFGFVVQAIGMVELGALTRALSVGSAYFITISYSVAFGFAVVCGIVGAVIGALLQGKGRKGCAK